MTRSATQNQRRATEMCTLEAAAHDVTLLQQLLDVF